MMKIAAQLHEACELLVLLDGSLPGKFVFPPCLSQQASGWIAAGRGWGYGGGVAGVASSGAGAVAGLRRWRGLAWSPRDLLILLGQGRWLRLLSTGRA